MHQPSNNDDKYLWRVPIIPYVTEQREKVRNLQHVLQALPSFRQPGQLAVPTHDWDQSRNRFESSEGLEASSVTGEAVLTEMFDSGDQTYTKKPGENKGSEVTESFNNKYRSSGTEDGDMDSDEEPDLYKIKPRKNLCKTRKFKITESIHNKRGEQGNRVEDQDSGEEPDLHKLKPRNHLQRTKKFRFTGNFNSKNDDRKDAFEFQDSDDEPDLYKLKPRKQAGKRQVDNLGVNYEVLTVPSVVKYGTEFGFDEMPILKMENYLENDEVVYNCNNDAGGEAGKNEAESTGSNRADLLENDNKNDDNC